MVEIEWTEKSTRHIQAIYEYITSDSRIYAEKYIKSLIVSTEKLKKMPKCGRIVPEFENYLLREIIFKSHRIVYRFEERRNKIQILAVVHHSQDVWKTIWGFEYFIEKKKALEKSAFLFF